MVIACLSWRQVFRKSGLRKSEGIGTAVLPLFSFQKARNVGSLYLRSPDTLTDEIVEPPSTNHVSLTVPRRKKIPVDLSQGFRWPPVPKFHLQCQGCQAIVGPVSAGHETTLCLVPSLLRELCSTTRWKGETNRLRVRRRIIFRLQLRNHGE